MVDVQRVEIFDTTLRDGQQSPGAGMSVADNLEFARLAQLLRIDVLEAGFPAASAVDFNIVHMISEWQSESCSRMKIAALCQLREGQFVRTMESLQPCLASNRARLHTYLPVDPNLMQASLGLQAGNESYWVGEVYRLIKLAVDAGYEVEFSPEGYSRAQTSFDFVTDVIRAAVAAGATIINCPDTIGGASVYEGDGFFVNMMRRHAAIMAGEFPDTALCWSAHCHNDLGMATQNSLEAVFNGPARQIEGCINGVGERAGNAALEQSILYISQFGATVAPNIKYETGIDMAYLQQASDFIAQRMLPRQPHSPVVGANAMRHSSGGHTNAVLSNPMAYQPFDPKTTGGNISFVFGPLSGSNHAQYIIVQHGYPCDDNEKAQVCQYIKDYYSDRRKGITDEELMEAYFSYRSPLQVGFSWSKSGSGYELRANGKWFEQRDPVWGCVDKPQAVELLWGAMCEKLPGWRMISRFIDEYKLELQILNDERGSCRRVVDLTSNDLISCDALVCLFNQAYSAVKYKLAVS